MKHALLACALLLAGCAPASLPLDTLLQNPLYAEFYYNDLADRMATIEVNATAPANAAILENAELKATLTAAREQAATKAAEARSARDRGATGGFVPVLEQPSGQVMLIDGVLFTGPTFNTPPGADLQLYLSPAIDPRDVVFPDTAAVSLGPVQQHYGAGAYRAVAAPAGTHWRSVVLYDRALRRIYGFVQLADGPDAP